MGMMKRSIPEEITAYKEKFFFGCTVRQLLCGAGILALAIPTGIWGSQILSQDAIGYLIIIEVIPLAAIGWVSYNGMPMEQIAVKVLAYYVGTQRRKCKYLPFEDKVHETLIKIQFEEEKAQLIEEKPKKQRRGKRCPKK